MVTRKESMEATPRKGTCNGNYFCSSPRGYPIRFWSLFPCCYMDVNVKDHEVGAPRSKKARKGQQLDVRPRGGGVKTEALFERPEGSTKVGLTQRHLFGYFNLTHLQTATLCISCCLSLSLKLILVPLRQDKLILGKEESESHCRMEPGFVRPRAAVTTSGNGNNDNNDNVTSSDIVTTSGSDNKNLNSSDIYSTY